MQTTGERRPSMTNKQPQTPSQISSIPRPTLQTTFDDSSASNQPQNPLTANTTTPEAINFYLQRAGTFESNGSSSHTVPPALPTQPESQSFEGRPNARVQSTQQLNASRSNPSIASPTERMQKSSFKDLVAKFNQTGEATSPPPNFTIPKGGSGSAVGNNNLRQSRSRTPTEGNPSSAGRSPRRGSSQPFKSKENIKPAASTSQWTPLDSTPLIVRPRTTQPAEDKTPKSSHPPLFGEVQAESQAMLSPGYGIPRQKRRGSEGSMHYPNPMFPHSRNRSTADIAQQQPSSWQQDDPSSAPTTARSHSRSTSDMSGTATPRVTDPFKFPPPSEPQSSGGAELPHSQAYAAGMLRSRYGFSGPFTTAPQQDMPLLMSKHNVSPSKSNGTGQRLKAIIKEPAPKKSPPLRSSRPRQHVSHMRPPSSSGQDSESRYPNIGSPERRRYQAVSSAEFATRRESIRRALQQSDLQGLRSAGEEPVSASPLLQTQTSLTGSSSLGNENTRNLVPSKKLTVETRGIDTTGNEEPRTADTQGTQFEDDSPVLSIPGSFPETEDTETVQAIGANAIAKREEESVEQAEAKAGQTDSAARTGFAPTVELKRQPGTTTSQSSGITGRASPPPGAEDAGTIQIMLGGTSVLDQLRKDWAAQQNSSDAQTSVEGANGLLSTLGNASNRSPSLAHGSELPSSGHLTLDSDAYSVINRVLDEYRKSGVVSPEMVYEFQQHILETDPDFSDRDDVDSMTIAKTALEELIRDKTLEDFAHRAQRAVEPSPINRSFTSSSDDRQIDQFSNDMDGGAMAFVELDRISNQGDQMNQSQESKAIATTHSRNASNITDISQTESSATSQHDFAAEEEQSSSQNYGLNSANDSDRDTMSDYTVRGERGSIPNDGSKPQLPEIPETGGGINFTVNGEASPKKPLDGPSTTGESVSLAPTASSGAKVREPSPKTSQSILTAQSTQGSELTGTTMAGTQESTPTTSGMQSHHPSSTSIDTQSLGTQEQRRLARRKNLIKELVDTEFSFNQDMKVIEDIYKGTATAVETLSGDDRRVLFGNSAQVVEFSEEFLDSLKHAASSVYTMPRNNKWLAKNGSFSTSTSVQTDQSSLASSDANDEERDRKTFIGDTFSQHVARMEKVYGDYLKNHDNANQRLGKLQNIAQVRLWLNECHTYAADITSAWDLDSLLVKPVQRILKYPLLLNSLLESTTKDHPDYIALEMACKQTMDVSHRINESKKRAELLEQVINGNTKRRDFDATLGLSKAFGRRTEKLRQQVGLSDAVEDPEYKAIYEKFGGQFFQLQIVMRDVEMYVKCTEEFMKQFYRWIEAYGEMLDVGHTKSAEIESKWRRFALTVREVSTIALADHEAAVRKLCIQPMKAVLKLHDGPQNLIAKRKKRILEYAKFTSMKSRGEKIDKKTQEQGEQFMALNETLKEELPRLFHLTSKLVRVCLGVLVELKMQWHTTWSRKVKTVLEDQQVPDNYKEIEDAFHSDFNFFLAQANQMAILNGATLNDAANFLSPTSNWSEETPPPTVTPRQRNVLTKAHRGASFNSDNSPNLPDHSKRRSSSSFGAIQQEARTSGDHLFGPANGYPAQNRLRAASAASNPTSNPQQSTLSPRNPPYSAAPAQTQYINRPYPSIPQPQSAAGSNQNSPSIPSGQFAPGRPGSGSTSYYTSVGAPLTPSSGGQGGVVSSSSGNPSIPGGVFSSAMPMSESPNPSRPHSPNAASAGPSVQSHRNGNSIDGGPPSALGKDFKVLFLAASLFEFNIERTRTEGGYPYLTYVPGEVFDVIGEKGELWLAKNQDDPNCEVGWIWEKHFAKLMTDEY